MNEIENILLINRLLDIYGSLLTKSQLEIMNDYYELDLSLSEISENRNISRTAVSDSLKKGRDKLANYEDKLQICKVFDDVKKGKNDAEIKIINEIEEKLKNGI